MLVIVLGKSVYAAFRYGNDSPRYEAHLILEDFARTFSPPLYQWSVYETLEPRCPPVLHRHGRCRGSGIAFERGQEGVARGRSVGHHCEPKLEMDDGIRTSTRYPLL
jgi:hypothetical protein